MLRSLPDILIPLLVAQAATICALIVLIAAMLLGHSPCLAKPVTKPKGVVLTQQQVHELLLQWQKEPLPNLLRPQK